MAKFVQTEQIENVFNPSTHHIGRNTEVLHRIGQFIFNEVGHETGSRILAYDANDIGEIARSNIRSCSAIDDNRPGKYSARKPRH
jgi:hypothetical protein